jgi:peptide-methionine (R)-S-oxide reductase
MSREIEHSDDEWRSLLTTERFRILRRGGTEPAFANAYWDDHDEGEYHCGGCGALLFQSRDKFDSGTGWPSFARPVDEGAVEEHTDASLGMVRTEVVCARCGGHLGHVFDDGPPPSRKRYCMNSGALTFEPSQTPH